MGCGNLILYQPNIFTQRSRIYFIRLKVEQDRNNFIPIPILNDLHLEWVNSLNKRKITVVTQFLKGHYLQVISGYMICNHH